MYVITTYYLVHEAGMAARRITIVIDDDPGNELYADLGNGVWGVLKVALPGGGFHLEADGGTTAGYLNQRWAQHGGDAPWQ
jgi:hypothetical protein